MPPVATTICVDDLTMALMSGDSVDTLRRELLDQGWAADTAEQAIDEAVELVTTEMALDPDAAAAHLAKVTTDARHSPASAFILIGVVLLLIAGGLTVASYVAARPGGMFAFPIGLVGTGASMVLAGVIGRVSGNG